MTSCIMAYATFELLSIEENKFYGSKEQKICWISAIVIFQIFDIFNTLHSDHQIKRHASKQEIIHLVT